MTMSPEGAKLLQQMEDAKNAGDLGKLKQVLSIAKSMPEVNQGWIDGAFKEIEVLEKQAAAGITPGQLPQASSKASTSSSEGAKEDKEDPILKAASAFKQQGNGELKQGTKSGYKSAVKTYSQAIDLLHAEIRRTCTAAANQPLGSDGKPSEGGQPPPVQSAAITLEPSKMSPTLKAALKEHLVLLNQLLGNRAQAHLQLREFSQVVDDCRKCLSQLDSTNIKNYYRAARASFHNGLLQQSLDFCEGGLQHDPENSDLSKLKETVVSKLVEQRKIKDKLSGLTPQEIIDQQQELQRLWSQVQQLEQQINRRKTRRRTQELTKSYIDGVSSGSGSSTSTSDTPLYIPCGRAFINRKRETVVRDLDVLMSECDTELPKMEKMLGEMQARFDKAEAEFKELSKHLQMRIGGK